MYLFDTSRSDPPVSGNLTMTSNGKSFTMTFPASAAEVKSTMKNVFKVNFDFKVEKSGDCDEGFQYVVTALEPGVLPKFEFDLQTTGIFKPRKIHPSSRENHIRFFSYNRVRELRDTNFSPPL